MNNLVRSRQWALLEPALSAALERSAFQRKRLPSDFRRPASIEAFVGDFPLTTKKELAEDQHRNPPTGSNLALPESRYTRFSQTSGTTARPLTVWDTDESWTWLLENWIRGFELAEVAPGMRAFFAFSFGPFLGFWTAFEAALRMGLRCIPGGGLGTNARLHAILEQQVEVLCCTPTYALHLAAAAASHRVDLSSCAVRKIIVAGEPGGSLPGVRRQIQLAWPAAELIDHYGLTEVGPVAFAKAGEPGQLRVLEDRYFAEVLDPETLQTVPEGGRGELVLTPLGRSSWPLFRYRTGDLVRPRYTDYGLVLDGGILGRVDDMVVVRGVNLYPGAVEEVVRSVVGSVEFRVTLSGGDGLAQIEIEIESPPEVVPLGSYSVTPSESVTASLFSPDPAVPSGREHSSTRLLPNETKGASPGNRVSASDTSALRLEAAFERAFSLRIPVREVPHGTLPRFDLKARRWVRMKTKE